MRIKLFLSSAIIAASMFGSSAQAPKHFNLVTRIPLFDTLIARDLPDNTG